MKYNVIFFDADGTLLDFDKDERNAITKAFTNLQSSLTINLEEIVGSFSVINKDIWIEMEDRLITPEDLKVERFKRLLNKLQLEISPCEISNQYMNYLSEGGFAFDGVHDVLSKLKGLYTLVLITNGSKDTQYKRLMNSNIVKYFDSIIVSEEVGHSKPSTKIFEYALRISGCNSREEVLMVGDSLTSDIRGANLVNIDTCWVNWSGIVNNTEFIPTYEIKNIKELFDIL